MNGWERTAQVALLVASGGMLGWLFWLVEKAERVERMGVDEADWKIKRERVAKNMTQQPEWYRRVVKKWNAAGRLGSQKLNGRT